MQENYLGDFDLVLESGIFNICLGNKSEHLNMVKKIIYKMWERAKRAVALNFLATSAIDFSNQEDLQSGRYFYFSPEIMLGFIRTFCSQSILRQDYKPGDFTLYLIKEGKI